MNIEIAEEELTVKIKVSIPPRRHKTDEKIVVSHLDVEKILRQKGYKISHLISGIENKLSNTWRSDHLTCAWKFAKIREAKKEVIDETSEKNKSRTTRTRKPRKPRTTRAKKS